MAIHLTPTELAREAGLERREVIEKCMELGVPIFQGRIDKTLFLANLSTQSAPQGTARRRGRRPAARAAASRSITRRRRDAPFGRSVTPAPRLVDRSVRTRAEERRWKLPRRWRRPRIRPGRGRSPTCCGSRREKYADNTAVRYKRDGEWQDVTYREVGEIVSEIGRGLIDLGLEPGDRVVAAAQHAPRVDLRRLRDHQRRRRRRADLPDQLARGVRVGRRQLRVARRSSARTPSRSPRSSRSASELPDLEHIIVIDADGAHERRDHARRPPRARPRPRRGRARPSAPRAVTARRPVHLHLHVRHHRPAEGLRAHARQLPRRAQHVSSTIGVVGEDDVVYLYLPLAHSFALLIQLVVVRPRRRRSPTSAATRSRSSRSSTEVKPTYLPSVPRIFEKIYTLAHGAIQPQGPRRSSVRQADRSSACKVRDLPARRRRRSPSELQAPFEQADEQLFANVRAACSAAACARRSPAPRRSPRRSSSSSTPAACRCSRATA